MIDDQQWRFPDFLHNLLNFVVDFGDGMLAHRADHIRLQPFPSLFNKVKIWAIREQENQA
ncbi:hypothetical protein EBB07_34560 [Paenibacillaceae bacterium]|nr:hypothetical protein EBB07_34560 [Paenibacillaceae bacterium]